MSTTLDTKHILSKGAQNLEELLRKSDRLGSRITRIVSFPKNPYVLVDPFYKGERSFVQGLKRPHDVERATRFVEAAAAKDPIILAAGEKGIAGIFRVTHVALERGVPVDRIEKKIISMAHRFIAAAAKETGKIAEDAGRTVEGAFSGKVVAAALAGAAHTV